MMRVYLLISFLVFGLACKTTKQVTSMPAANKEQSEKLANLFFEAKAAMVNEQWWVAKQKFEDYITQNPVEPAAHYELARICRTQLSLPMEGLTHANYAYSQDKKNKWYALEYARCLAVNDHESEAINVYKKTAALDQSWSLPYFEMYEVHATAGDFKKAIDDLNAIQKIQGLDEKICHLKQAAYIELKDNVSAGKELENLALEFPFETRFTLMAAEFYYGIGDVNSCKRVIANSKIGDSGYIHYLQYKISVIENNPQLHFLEKSMEYPDLDVDRRIGLLVPFLMNKNPKTDPVIDRCLQTNCRLFPESAKIFACAGDFYYMRNQDSLAIVHYQRTILLDPSKSQVWKALLSLKENHLQSNSDRDQYLELSSSANELFPFEPEFFYHNVKANLESGNFQEALNQVQIGLELMEGGELKNTMLVFKAEALYFLHQEKEADQVIQRLLQDRFLTENNVMQMAFVAYALNRSITGLNEVVLSAYQINPKQPFASAVMHLKLWSSGNDPGVTLLQDCHSWPLALSNAIYCYLKQNNPSQGAAWKQKASSLGASPAVMNAILEGNHLKP